MDDYYTIDGAMAEDIETIARFQVEMALESEDLDLDYDTVCQGVEALIEDPAKGEYFVARKDDGELVGSLLVTKEWSDWRCAWYWWIQSVYVHPEHRGKGIFSSLFDEVIRKAEAENVSEVRLYVDKTNTDAQETYERVGMEQSHYLMYSKKL